MMYFALLAVQVGHLGCNTLCCARLLSNIFCYATRHFAGSQCGFLDCAKRGSHQRAMRLHVFLS